MNKSELDDKQIDLLKQFWKDLLSRISDNLSNLFDNPLGDELFFLFARDDPDVILVRWLKARQWNVELALESLFKTLQWRIQFNIKQLLKQGENHLNQQELLTNKTYHLGRDRQGFPLTYVHACQHIKGQFPYETTEKFVVLNMELSRYLVDEYEQQQATVVLDMSNISFQNLDYQHIRFMIETMQNYYPECLSKALIVNAPWGFHTVWNLIQLWLDKNVAKKVHFVSNAKDLSQFIHPDFIPKKLKGNHSDFEFIPANEQHRTQIQLIHSNQSRFNDLLQQYQRNAQIYLDFTLKWINSNDEQLVIERTKSSQLLSQSFLQLLPFVFSPTIYHRNRSIQLPIYDLIC